MDSGGCCAVQAMLSAAVCVIPPGARRARPIFGMAFCATVPNIFVLFAPLYIFGSLSRHFCSIFAHFASLLPPFFALTLSSTFCSSTIWMTFGSLYRTFSSLFRHFDSLSPRFELTFPPLTDTFASLLADFELVPLQVWDASQVFLLLYVFITVPYRTCFMLPTVRRTKLSCHTFHPLSTLQKQFLSL